MKRPRPEKPVGGYVIAIGMFLASILDPKTKVMTELVDKKQSRERTDPGKENA